MPKVFAFLSLKPLQKLKKIVCYKKKQENYIDSLKKFDKIEINLCYYHDLKKIDILFSNIFYVPFDEQ